VVSPKHEGNEFRKLTSLEMDAQSEKIKEELVFVNPEKKRKHINYKQLDRLRQKTYL